MSIQIRELRDGELDQMLVAEKADRTMFALSDDNIESLRRYIEDRIEPGNFIMAVLHNDLKEAAGRADMYNRRKLFEYVEYLYNHAPSVCWGSSAKVDAWLSGAA